MSNDPENALENALLGMAAEEGPALLTNWVVMVEFIDSDGSPRLGSYASDMPPWRLSGIVDEGHSILLGQYEEDDADTD